MEMGRRSGPCPEGRLVFVAIFSLKNKNFFVFGAICSAEVAQQGHDQLSLGKRRAAASALGPPARAGGSRSQFRESPASEM